MRVLVLVLLGPEGSKGAAVCGQPSCGVTVPLQKTYCVTERLGFDHNHHMCQGAGAPNLYTNVSAGSTNSLVR